MLKRLLVVAAAVAALAAPSALQAGGQKDIVDTAVAAGSFKTLATALKAAGLIDTLKGPGPFTVFAPTDEAFAKIPKADLDASSPTRRSSPRSSPTTWSPARSWPRTS